MRTKISFIFLLCYGLAMSSTYYVDFASGSDANNGTSKTTPWKRQPYMAGWAGSYSHNVGDHFIFKGGVTWPNACFPVNITTGGSVAYWDYYGVDKTWYIGGAFARPIFDLQGAQTASTNRVVSLSLDAGSNIFFQNIEITGFYWSGAQSWGNGCQIVYSRNKNITFNNIYIHNWTHGTYAGGTLDGMICFLGYTSSPGDSNVVIDSCECSGIPSTTSGMGTYGEVSVVQNSSFHDMCSGIINLPTGSTAANLVIKNNTIYNLNNSFDPTQHMDALYLMGAGYAYKNIIHDISGSGVMSMYLSPGFGGVSQDNIYCYNNVIYNITANNSGITYDCESGNYSGTIYLLNNTVLGLFSGTGGCLNVVNRANIIATSVIENNHWITSGMPTCYNSGGCGTITSVTIDHNLTMSPATAKTQGYVAGNNYAPTSGSNSTVDAGTSEASYFKTDILGVTRPQGSAWDIGAYEYVANLNPPVITSQPSNLTKNVGQQATFAIAATGTGTLTYQWSKFSINIPGATNSSFTTPVLVLGDNGNIYTCLVKDNNGSTMSQSATLAVYQIGIPIISSLVPSSGNYVGGYNVHLSSSNVLTSGGNPTIVVGSKNVTGFSSADNSVDFTMPSGPVGQTNVILTNYQGGKDTAVFTRDSSFYFASVSPVSSTNGTIISYHGGGFKPNQGTGTITMDSVFIITSWNDTLIQAKLNVNRFLNTIRNSAGSKNTIAGSILGGTLTY